MACELNDIEIHPLWIHAAILDPWYRILSRMHDLYCRLEYVEIGCNLIWNLLSRPSRTHGQHGERVISMTPCRLGTSSLNLHDAMNCGLINRSVQWWGKTWDGYEWQCRHQFVQKSEGQRIALFCHHRIRTCPRLSPFDLMMEVMPSSYSREKEISKQWATYSNPSLWHSTWAFSRYYTD